MRFSPGGRFDTPPYPAGTYLRLTVFTGALTLHAGARTLAVESGDTVRFAGDQDFRGEAPDDVAAIAWLVVGLPEFLRRASAPLTLRFIGVTRG